MKAVKKTASVKKMPKAQPQAKMPMRAEQKRKAGMRPMKPARPYGY